MRAVKQSAVRTGRKGRGARLQARGSGREQGDDPGPEADEGAGAEGPQDRPLGAEDQEGSEGCDCEGEWLEAVRVGHLEVHRAPGDGADLAEQGVDGERKCPGWDE